MNAILHPPTHTHTPFQHWDSNAVHCSNKSNFSVWESLSFILTQNWVSKLDDKLTVKSYFYDLKVTDLCGTRCYGGISVSSIDFSTFEQVDCPSCPSLLFPQPASIPLKWPSYTINLSSSFSCWAQMARTEWPRKWCVEIPAHSRVHPHWSWPSVWWQCWSVSPPDLQTSVLLVQLGILILQ